MAGNNGTTGPNVPAENLNDLGHLNEATADLAINPAQATETANQPVGEKVVEATEKLAQAAEEGAKKVTDSVTKNRKKAKPAAPAAGPVESAPVDEAELEAEQPGVGVAPKTFLIPYVLLMLRNSFLHGYAIWERLMLMGIPGLDENDRATIYRTLRQLEREGKVKSEWDTNTEGPARRVYTLTDAGESFLQIWAVGLDQYRQSLDFFFKLYTGGALPSPFGFKLNNPKSGGNKPPSNGGKNV